MVCHGWMPMLVLPALTMWATACIVERDTHDDRFGHDGATGQQGGAGATGGQGGHGVAGGPSSSSSGSSSGSSSSGSSSSGSSSGCPDPGAEPNDSEALAIDLGTIDDCDSSGAQVSGVLAGNDVDWYRYQGTDGWLCQVGASVELTADGQARACQFVDCPGLELACPGSTTAEQSPDGLAGCCAIGGFQLGFNCAGPSEDATVFIRIDKPPAFPCVSYSVDYHY